MHFKKTASATLIKPAQVTLDKHNEILGRGSLGVVKKGYYRGEAVVIKSLTFKENGKLDPLVSAEQFIREARALGEINHPTLVELKGIVMGTLSIVFEYMPLGSLKDLIRRLSPTETDNKHGTIKWSDRYQIITDIVEGMRYLHSLKRQENGKMGNNDWICFSFPLNNSRTILRFRCTASKSKIIQHSYYKWGRWSASSKASRLWYVRDAEKRGESHHDGVNDSQVSSNGRIR